MRFDRPIAIAMAGGVATIGTELVVAPLVLEAVQRGADPWWLWALFAPLLVLLAGLAIAARVDHRIHRRTPPGIAGLVPHMSGQPGTCQAPQGKEPRPPNGRSSDKEE